MARQTTTRPKVVNYLINVGPGSAPTIAKAIGLEPGHVSKSLWSLRRDGRAHIASYENVGGRRQTVYAYGGGEDFPRPPPMTQLERDRIRRGTSSIFKTRVVAYPQLLMMAALMVEPLTREELQGHMGCSRDRVGLIVAEARRLGLIYIFDHVAPRKKRIPRFRAQSVPFEHPDAKLK